MGATPTLDQLLLHRPVSQEILAGLEVLDNGIYPLPGAFGRRPGALDPRLIHITTKDSDVVCFYEHLATVRHRPSGIMFVAFRETMDALLMKQKDPARFPKWLMDHPVKKTELSTYIYRVKRLPAKEMRTHEEWLEHVADTITFDTICFFLLKNGIITQEAYGRAQ